MNIQDEKKFLYSMMQNITEERKNLTEIYLELMKKINKLEMQEHRENFDDKSMPPPPVIKDEELYQNVVIEDKSVDGKTLQEYIDSYNQSFDENYQYNEDLAYNSNMFESVIPKAEIEREKDKLPRRSASLNMDKVSGLIILILKEKGAPISVKDIHKELNERMDSEVTMQNLRNNILPRVCKKNTKIERATRGFYQYRF